MKLRSIYISVYGYSEASEFGFETRSLCNYVQRAARGMQIQTDGFNTVVIQAADDATAAPFGPPRLVPEKSLQVPFAYNRSRYRLAALEQKQQYFEELLIEGLGAANACFPLPVDELFQVIASFRENGRKNEWVHCRRRLKGTDLIASLRCQLSMSEFTLDLDVEREGKRVWTGTILREKPDELCYHFRFRDVLVRGDKIVVSDKFDRSTFELPFSDVPP